MILAGNCAKLPESTAAAQYLFEKPLELAYGTRSVQNFDENLIEVGGFEEANARIWKKSIEVGTMAE